MMIMIAPNSLGNQKEGYQGEEEEEAREEAIGATRPGADALTGPTRSGVSDTRNRRKHGW